MSACPSVHLSVSLYACLCASFYVQPSVLLSTLLQSNFNGSNIFGIMKISSRQGYFEPMRVAKSARSGGIIRISLSFYNMRVCCVFSLESPHCGDSDENTKYTIFNIKTKITLNYPNSAAMGFFPRDLRTCSKQPW